MTKIRFIYHSTTSRIFSLPSPASLYSYEITNRGSGHLFVAPVGLVEPGETCRFIRVRGTWYKDTFIARMFKILCGEHSV